jgi:hypothetical protein
VAVVAQHMVQQLASTHLQQQQHRCAEDVIAGKWRSDTFVV